MRHKKAFYHSREKEIKNRNIHLINEINSFLNKQSLQKNKILQMRRKIDSRNEAKNISEYVDMRLRGINEIMGEQSYFK